MNTYFLICILSVLLVKLRVNDASMCGCKTVRRCYHDMIETLKYRDEEACIEDAAIGASTIMIFLKAIKQFCGEFITVNSESLTYEGRNLYEVVLTTSGGSNDIAKPVILVEAGQQGGSEPVGLALHLVEQLVACQEFADMLQKVRWVILPCTNPDGMEYARFNRVQWKKNAKPSRDNLSFGVDISRNFDSQWASCDPVESGFSNVYAGPSAGSENETVFINNMLQKYKSEMKAYLSIRRDGHGIFYPFAYTKSTPNEEQMAKIAADISSKVNQRAGGVQVFLNESIHDANGKPQCGHSVDYAQGQGIPLTYEMRVFLGSDNRVMSKFHALPRGYETSLRMGYFSGIRELYNLITNDKKRVKVIH